MSAVAEQATETAEARLARHQLAIDAIARVCAEHGVALLGSCEREGIYGEIEIVDDAEMTPHLRERVTNAVSTMHNGQMHYVVAVGSKATAG